MCKLAKLEKAVRQQAMQFDPWTDVYGLSRSLIALSTMLTLAFNDTSILFHPAVGLAGGPQCPAGQPQAYGLFCSGLDLELIRWVAIAGLALVASGWRPRLTGILHWWITASVFWNAIPVDGGEQIASIITLLLIPVTLTDDRRWHWSPRPSVEDVGDATLRHRLVARVAIGLIRLQVAVLYFHASAGKLPVHEWSNGTVLYYWLRHPTFGLTPEVQDLVWPLMTNATLIGLVTWSVLVVEAVLAAGLVADRRHWKYFLWLGLALHGGIALIHGLPSFVTIMFGALVISYRPADQPFFSPRRSTPPCAAS